MKKLLVALLVVVLCAPAMAVTVTLSEPVDGTLRVSYALEAGETNIRGLALVFETTDGDAVLDSVPANDFNTFIDYAYANSGYTIGAGHPVADPDAAGVIDPATNPSKFSISMGYLDEGGAQAGLVDSFFDVVYTLSVDSDVTVTVDTLRGGIVGDDVAGVTITNPVITLTGASVPTCEDQFTGDAAALYARYKAQGNEPLAWCWQYQCHGDADNATEYLLFVGDLRIYNADLTKIINNWKGTPEGGCDPAADIDHAEEYLLFVGDLAVYNADLTKVVNNWRAVDGDLTNCPEYDAIQ